MWWLSRCQWLLSSSSCHRYTWRTSPGSCSPSPLAASGGHDETSHRWKRRQRGSGSTSWRPRTGWHHWRRGAGSRSCSFQFHLVLWVLCSKIGPSYRAPGLPGRQWPQRESPWWLYCVQSYELGKGSAQCRCNRSTWPRMGGQKPKPSGPTGWVHGAGHQCSRKWYMCC